MNKIGMVLGVAAVATLAGCKDPNFKYGNATQAQNEVKSAEGISAAPVEIAPKSAPAVEQPAVVAQPVAVEKPVVVEKLPPPPPPPPAVAPESTVYIVQNGDYLSKISKKYNIRVDAIRKANPRIKKDIIWPGMKLNLPGKVDVGVQAAPVVRKAVRAKKAYAPYAGATKEYVVKSGDSLGAIAYGNGINIRQLKELNGLKSDFVRVGQKLKIPAEKVVAPVKEDVKKPAIPAPAAKTVAPAPATPVSAAPAAAPTAAAAPAVTPAPAAPAAETTPAPEAKADAAAPATTTYVVQEGDDLLGVSIRWGVSAAVIRELNNLNEKDQLVTGQIIKLPADAQQ